MADTIIQAWQSSQEILGSKYGTQTDLKEPPNALALVLNLQHIEVKSTLEKLGLCTPEEIKSHKALRTTFVVIKMLYAGWSFIDSDDKDGKYHPKGKPASGAKGGAKEKLGYMDSDHAILHCYKAENKKGVCPSAEMGTGTKAGVCVGAAVECFANSSVLALFRKEKAKRCNATEGTFEAICAPAAQCSNSTPFRCESWACAENATACDGLFKGFACPSGQLRCPDGACYTGSEMKDCAKAGVLWQGCPPGLQRRRVVGDESSEETQLEEVWWAMRAAKKRGSKSVWREGARRVRAEKEGGRKRGG